MPISKGKKRLAYVVLLIYALFVGAFVVKTMRYEEPANRGAWVEALVKTSENKLAEGEVPIDQKVAGEIYDRYVAEKGNIIGLNYTMFMQILNFIVFLVAFYVLIWDPMIALLDKRRASIGENISTARRTREEAEDEMKRAHDAVHSARRERMELREVAQHEADEDRQRIMAEAQQQAERMLQETQRRIEAEAEEARTELRREVGAMAVEIARRVLDRELEKADHDRLVDELIAELESEKAANGNTAS